MSGSCCRRWPVRQSGRRGKYRSHPCAGAPAAGHTDGNRRPSMNFNVQSEAGQLKQVIVHRPGLELSRLTPRNVGELLFDDVLWAGRAREEHDAFAEALRARGVRVHYFGQLLAETLEVPAGRAFVLDRLCVPEMLGPNLAGPVRQLFDDLDGPALAEFLIGGVLK